MNPLRDVFVLNLPGLGHTFRIQLIGIHQVSVVSTILNDQGQDILGSDVLDH